MERIAWWRTAVKDSSSAVTGALSLRRRARAAASSLRSAAAALARASWVAVSQAQASWMTSRGEPERSTGPEVRFPAPVIVVLSSPNVVSDALHRVRYVSRSASAGAARWSRRVVIRVQVSETSPLPVAAGQDRVVLGSPDREPVFFLPGRGVQPGHAGSVGQPAAAGLQRQAIPAFTRATTCPPASRIAEISSWPGRVGCTATATCPLYAATGLFRAASLRTRHAPFSAPGFLAIYAACATGFAWM